MTAVKTKETPLKSPVGTSHRFAHVPALDGLRGISMLLVMGFHQSGPIGVQLAAGFGWIGVHNFFTLSGFLITALLLTRYRNRRDIEIGRFLRARCFRILPAYLSFIGLAFLYPILIGYTHLILPVSIAAVGLTDCDVSYGWGFTSLSGLYFTWSLCVEEKFYLFYPSFLKFVSRPLATVISCIALLQLWKAYVICSEPPWLRVSASFDTNFDSILIGCAFAIIWCRSKAQTERNSLLRLLNPAAVAILFLLSTVSILHPSAFHSVPQQMQLWIVQIPIHGLITGLLILVLIEKQSCLVSRIFSFTPLAWIGKISYSVYLTHLLIFDEVNNSVAPLLGLAKSAPALEPVRFALSFAVGYTWYQLIELPFIRLRQRLDNRDAHNQV